MRILGYDEFHCFFQIAEQVIERICNIESHHTLPIIAVATKCGTVFIYELNDTALKFISQYYLSSVGVNILKFVINSSTLIAFDDENAFFHIQMNSYDVTDIEEFFQFNDKPIDTSIIEINEILHVMILCVKPSTCFCLYYQIKKNIKRSHKITNIPLNHWYSSWQFFSHNSNECVLGTRNPSQTIDIFNVKANCHGVLEFSLQKCIQTDSVDRIKLSVDTSSVFTFGCGGLIIQWNKKSMEIDKSIIAYDKFSCGVYDITFNEKYILNFIAHTRAD